MTPENISRLNTFYQPTETVSKFLSIDTLHSERESATFIERSASSKNVKGQYHGYYLYCCDKFARFISKYLAYDAKIAFRPLRKQKKINFKIS